MNCSLFFMTHPWLVHKFQHNLLLCLTLSASFDIRNGYLDMRMRGTSCHCRTLLLLYLDVWDHAMARGQTKLNDMSAYRLIRKCLIPSLQIAQKFFGSVYYIFIFQVIIQTTSIHLANTPETPSTHGTFRHTTDILQTLTG